MIDYKTLNNKGNKYIFVTIDNFSKYLWGLPLKNKTSQTVTNELSDDLTTSKLTPATLESDRGKNFIFLFVKTSEKNMRHYSRCTDKGPSIADRVIRTIGILLGRPVLEKRNAVWLSELPSVVKLYNNSNHHSIKMSPFQASE